MEIVKDLSVYLSRVNLNLKHFYAYLYIYLYLFKINVYFNQCLLFAVFRNVIEFIDFIMGFNSLNFIHRLHCFMFNILFILIYYLFINVNIVYLQFY